MKSIVRKAWILAFTLTLAGGLFQGWRFGLSVLLGALLALLNIRWMTSGVDRLLGRTRPKSDAVVVAQFLLRLVLIFLVLFAMIRLSFLSLAGTMLGLSVFVLAGMAEAVWLLLNRGEPNR